MRLNMRLVKLDRPDLGIRPVVDAMSRSLRFSIGSVHTTVNVVTKKVAYPLKIIKIATRGMG